ESGTHFRWRRCPKTLLGFVESVISKVPKSEEVIDTDPGEEDPEKTRFLASIGLTTKRARCELELDRFVQRKINRRLSHASFKLDSFQQDGDDDDQMCRMELDGLKPDSVAHFLPSDIEPDSLRSATSTEGEQEIGNRFMA